MLPTATGMTWEPSWLQTQSSPPARPPSQNIKFPPTPSPSRPLFVIYSPFVSVQHCVTCRTPMGLGTALRRVWASQSASSPSRRHSQRSHSHSRKHHYPKQPPSQPSATKLEHERMVIASYRVRVQKIADRISRKWLALDEKPDEYNVMLELRDLRRQLTSALESYYGALGSRSAADVTDVLKLMEKTDVRLAQIDAEVVAEVGLFEKATADITNRFHDAADESCRTEVVADADDMLIELELYRHGWSRLMNARTRTRLDQTYAQLKSIVELSISKSPASNSTTSPWLDAYPPPVNGKLPYARADGPAPYGPVGAPPYDFGCNGTYNETFYAADPRQKQDTHGGFEGNTDTTWEGKRPAPAQRPRPSSGREGHARQNGRKPSSSSLGKGQPVPNGTLNPIDEQQEGGSSESGDEGPMRMVIARTRTLRDMAQNVMGEKMPSAPYVPPKVSRDRSNPKVSASDFIVSTPGSSADSQHGQTWAAFSNDLDQPVLSQLKQGSFASALYYTRHERVNAISDAGILLQRSNVKGDGRCLFRSLARGRAVARGKSIPSERVERDEADNLRDRAVAELIKHRDLLLRFFVIEGDFGQYTKRMSNPRTFGGEPELLMLAKLLHIPIAVYILKNGLYRKIQVYGKQYRGEPLRILYSDGVHYDALLVVKR